MADGRAIRAQGLFTETGIGFFWVFFFSVGGVLGGCFFSVGWAHRGAPRSAGGAWAGCWGCAGGALGGCFFLFQVELNNGCDNCHEFDHEVAVLADYLYSYYDD